ncbi:KEOPS complex subunit Cgi121 [Salinibaculum rarum]|uniref:KEOPS complex subunit Cgi121 n=1 Tax=Salinibaculum rarum TaxID=3058903 RepID=UPI00265F45F4|nr:KEOPS complex subunit Cgi121 [Salinibaculum sp. KK48]
MEVIEGTATVEDVDAFVEELGAIGAEYGVAVQAFDARYVVGREHLERAVALANRAAERDEMIARNRAVEILLYAAGRRQINRALEIGVDEGTTPAVVVVDDGPAGGDEADAAGGDEAGAAAAVGDLLDPAATLGEYDRERVMDFFDISERELGATEGTLADVVCERVALLTVER